jgi:hypothetical protein
VRKATVVRFFRRDVLAALAVCALLAACQPSASATVGPTPSPTSAGPTDAPLPLTDPVEGVLTHVDSTGLDSVTGFDLRASDGKTYHFEIGRLQNAAAFPPGHLLEHAASSEPVRVTFLELGPTIFAIRLEDAGPQVPSATPVASRTPAPS